MLGNSIYKAMVVCLIALSLPVFVSADEEAIKSGEKKAMLCTACHGVENSNNPEWPNLSQQSKKYLVEQLHAFRDGIRNNALMSSQAMGLSDEDINDLASYYNNVKSKRGVLPADDSNIELGQKIYRGGIADRAVPACISCHGPNVQCHDVSVCFVPRSCVPCCVITLRVHVSVPCCGHPAGG